MITMTKFRTVQASGLNVFYREAGENGAPRLLLLGGFPSSSHQFPTSSRHWPIVPTSCRLTIPASGTPTCLTRQRGITRSTISPMSSTQPCRVLVSRGVWGSTSRITAARSAIG